MSMYKLSNGICSERTISRIERKLTRPQSSIIHKLFERLGLSGELSQSELISSNVEAQKMLQKFRISINYKKNKYTDSLLSELERKVSMDIPQNRQTLIRMRAWTLRAEGCMTNETFVAQIKKLLNVLYLIKLLFHRININL